MSRETLLYLKDIRESCDRIRSYVDEMSYEEFLSDQRTYDAVVRNLEIIGEAARHVPESIRKELEDVPFRQIGDMRNLLIHGYFGIDDDILWDVVTRHLAPLREAVDSFLKKSGQ